MYRAVFEFWSIFCVRKMTLKSEYRIYFYVAVQCVLCYRSWYTLTGTYGNLLPINWSQGFTINHIKARTNSQVLILLLISSFGVIIILVYFFAFGCYSTVFWHGIVDEQIRTNLTSNADRNCIGLTVNIHHVWLLLDCLGYCLNR